MNRISDITKKINFPEGMEIYKINKNLKINFKNEEDFWEKVVDLIIKKSNDPEGVVLPDIDNLAKQNHFGKYSLCPSDPRMEFDGNILVKVVVNRLKKYKDKTLTRKDQEEIAAIFNEVGNILGSHFGSYFINLIIDYNQSFGKQNGVQGLICNMNLDSVPEKKDEFIFYSSETDEDNSFGKYYFQPVHVLVCKHKYNLTDLKLNQIPWLNDYKDEPKIVTNQAIEELCQDLKKLANHGFELKFLNNIKLINEDRLYFPSVHNFICHNPKLLHNNRDSVNENYEDEFMKNRNNKEFLDKYINKIKEKIKNCKNIIIK